MPRMSPIEYARRWLQRRRRAYNATFRNPEGELVLHDLARFCRALDTTFHSDPRASALMEGRREVWLRIQEHLNLSEEELWELRRPDSGAVIQQPEDESDGT